MEEFTYFATAPRGLESVVARELKAFASDVTPAVGGVWFKGDLEIGYRANLWLRTGIRVLLQLSETIAPDAERLYAGAGALPWEAWFTPDDTFMVSATLRKSSLRHSHFVALKCKDAIADRFSSTFGRRPNVDTRNPGIGIRVHIEEDVCRIFLDMSGQSLHRRGYRRKAGPAPLNEALAAGILLLAGYSGDRPLVDPMCGSGTLVIEAALVATRTAPGLLRTGFAFQNWQNFDASLWHRLVQEAQSLRRENSPSPILGSDRDAGVLEIARENARRAGMERVVHFSVQQIGDARPPKGRAGFVVTNPPYGARLGRAANHAELYKSIGATLRRRFRGYHAFILAGNPDLARHIALRPRKKRMLYNGPIRTQLIEFHIP